jgi:phosphatidylglycerophosphate synthase
VQLTESSSSYTAILRESRSRESFGQVLADYYAALISPCCTRLFLRWGVIPNAVTIGMIVSGMLGAVLFATPLFAAKIAGAVLIHLWYILDCSDGEVARLTGIFSPFGTELDQIAHAICHPLFNLSFAYSLFVLHQYNSSLILTLSVVSISAEMLLRHLIDLSGAFLRTSIGVATPAKSRSLFRIVAGRVLGIFYVYPNFALLFPVLYLVDRITGTSLAWVYFVAHVVLSALEASRLAYRWTRILYQA